MTYRDPYYPLDDVVKTVCFDNLLCFLRDITCINREHALCSGARSEQGQDPCPTTHIKDNGILEELRRSEDKRRISRSPDLVLYHDGVNLCKPFE